MANFTKFFLFALCFFNCYEARSQDLRGEFSNYLEQLSQLEAALTVEPQCQEVLEQIRSSCSSFTDSFCNTLWNSKNRGNMNVHDGKILTGVSPRSKNRLYVLEHYQAMIDSLPRLPADLRSRATPSLQQLQKLLKEEKNLIGDTTEWQRNVSDALTEFNRAKLDTSLERKRKKYPDILKKAAEDRSVEESLKVEAVEVQLHDEILKARYAEHTNWKRVEAVYLQAKSDILKEIESLNIAKDQKEVMIEKIRNAELSLPLTDPESVGADNDCGTTTVNAYYYRSKNKLVACAGMFNGYQSESALYHVIAHELGHSIDTNSQAEHDCRTKSPVAKALNKLVGAPGAVYSCEDWKSLKTDGPLKPSDKFVNLREKHPLEKLTSCLKDRSALDPLTSEAVKGAVNRSVKGDMSWYATRHHFLTIAQPTMTKYGETKENDIYLRPDKIMKQWYGGNSDGRLVRDVDPLEVFTQALSCQTVNKNGKTINYKNAESQQDKAEIFKLALDETSAVLKIKEQDFLSYCGQACRSLVSENLAADTGENFADWIAIRAGKHFLSRKSKMAEKREASALSTSLFCGEPGLDNDAPELALVEKGYSLQQHPDNRIRRISYYTLEAAKALGCAVDHNAQGFALCEP